MVRLYPNTDAWEFKVQRTKETGIYKCFVVGGSVEVSISSERIFILRNERGEELMRRVLSFSENHLVATRDFAQWADDLEFDE